MVATWPEAVRKTVGTQTEAPHKHVGVQAAGCRECWSLALAAEGGGENTCIRCEQVNDLLTPQERKQVLQLAKRKKSVAQDYLGQSLLYLQTPQEPLRREAVRFIGEP